MRSGHRLVGLATIAVLVFLYVPIGIIFLYAFNGDRAQTWPIQNWTTHWFGDAFTNESIREALLLSIEVALAATAVALLLGSLASFAVHRFRFFGRDAVSFLLVLPIALPGIVTGMALNATFHTGDIPFGFLTIVIGHATFCVVVVYNNVIARLRRSSPNIEEASMDLGADTWQTFRYVTLPVVRTALLAGGLLAFALSFDEVIVTTFTAGTQETLPIWILANLRLPNQRPLVNVVAVTLIVLSAIPVYLSHRVSSDAGGPGRRV
jgi:putative spermidine/putrescine transport system permease protein